MAGSGSDVALVLSDGNDGRKRAAYRAVPAVGRGKGVLVLDEGAALGDFGREVCERLAREGFTALAPDLAAPGEADACIEAGIRALLDDDATLGPRVGLLAFGEGAARWLAGGGDAQRLGCVALCGSAAAEPRRDVELPALVLVGAEDPRAEEAAALARSLGGAKLRRLEGAGEGFMDPARADRHDANAAARAWDALLSFLEGSL